MSIRGIVRRVGTAGICAIAFLLAPAWGLAGTTGALSGRVVNESGKDELWVSDGTRSGTGLLKTLRAGE